MRRASRRRSYWLRWLSAARGTPFTLIFIADAGGSSLGYAPRRPGLLGHSSRRSSLRGLASSAYPCDSHVAV
jgi:hypothetical protein